jgi:hypothetical protein
MTEFGENGTVAVTKMPGARASDYRLTKPKLKRVGLACFLCGVAACVSVALVAFAIGFVGSIAGNLMGFRGNFLSGEDFWAGAGFAVLLSAMNWWLFYVTIPAAWLALGLSIGRFPHRGIIRPLPYYRWASLWGAMLVGGTCLLFSGASLFGRSGIEPSFTIGAMLGGSLIGAIAGLACGWLFLAIVKPAEQVKQINVDVF